MTFARSATQGIRRSALLAGLVVFSACVSPTSWAIGQEMPMPDLPSRQVVMFGVVATPGSTEMDPKITPVVAAQLRKALPGHGFKLIQVKSQRVIQGQSFPLKLGAGFESTALLLNALDPNGKVQLKFELTCEGVSQFQTVVVTPADQFNFFDKMLPDNSHLLIGVGAR